MTRTLYSRGVKTVLARWRVYSSLHKESLLRALGTRNVGTPQALSTEVQLSLLKTVHCLTVQAQVRKTAGSFPDPPNNVSPKFFSFPILGLYYTALYLKCAIPLCLGLPWYLSWLRICLQCGRPGFNPLAGKIPWRRERPPTPVIWPGEFHG